MPDITREIDKTLAEYVIKNKIPGLALIIVDSTLESYTKFLGYANIKEEIPISEATLFELGSNSKAFTALAILILEDQGLLSLDDPITNYIPWFIMNYNGSEVVHTIRHFLNHTSGIPSISITDIQKANDKKAIENTIREIIKTDLLSEPGDRFEYATVNYDVLGLIIEYVSLLPYEEYMALNVFNKLGLNNTRFHQSESSTENISKGYKLFAGKNIPYDPPKYRGNNPAGYVLSNVKDLEKWLVFNLGMLNTPFSMIRDKIHTDDGRRYSYGWNKIPHKNVFFHEGLNPTFSSFILVDKNCKSGFVILVNGSRYLSDIAFSINNILNLKPPNKITQEYVSKVDKYSFSIMLIISPLIIFLLYTFFRHKRIRLLCNFNKKRVLWSSSILLLISLIGIFYLPYLFNLNNWSFIYVWFPFSFLFCIGLIIVLLGTVYINVIDSI